MYWLEYFLRKNDMFEGMHDGVRGKTALTFEFYIDNVNIIEIQS